LNFGFLFGVAEESLSGSVVDFFGECRIVTVGYPDKGKIDLILVRMM
jgi:hypothetical protein